MSNYEKIKQLIRHGDVVEAMRDIQSIRSSKQTVPYAIMSELIKAIERKIKEAKMAEDGAHAGAMAADMMEKQEKAREMMAEAVILSIGMAKQTLSRVDEFFEASPEVHEFTTSIISIINGDNNIDITRNIMAMNSLAPEVLVDRASEVAEQIEEVVATRRLLREMAENGKEKAAEINLLLQSADKKVEMLQVGQTVVHQTINTQALKKIMGVTADSPEISLADRLKKLKEHSQMANRKGAGISLRGEGSSTTMLAESPILKMIRERKAGRIERETAMGLSGMIAPLLLHDLKLSDSNVKPRNFTPNSPGASSNSKGRGRG